MNQQHCKLVLAAAVVASGIVALASSVGAQGVGVEKLQNAMVPTPKSIERGSEIYRNQCAGCHGNDGTGRDDYAKEPFAEPVPDLTDDSYRHGGGPIQTYNVITEGLPGEAHHPTFTGALRFLERWSVTHYVRSLSLYSGTSADIAENPRRAAAAAVGGPSDPDDVVREARVTAKNGRCNPQIMEEIRANIGEQLEPKGEEQIAKGEELYQGKGTCYTCHGEDGTVLDAMEGQDIPPRNFKTEDADWQDGPNALAVYNSITNGARGQMRAFSEDLTVEERWAITHFLLEKWIPDEIQTSVGDEQLRGLCRQRSASDPPRPMWDREQFSTSPNPKEAAVEHAMERLVEQQSERDFVALQRSGRPELAADADADRGREIYLDQCSSCHGEGAQGRKLGPFGVERAPSREVENPKLHVQVRALQPAHAGGTFREFAKRAAGGVHATVPEMSAAGLLDAEDWKDLQAYVASIEGEEALRREPVRREPEPATPETDAGSDSPTAGGPDAGPEADNPAAGGAAPSTGPDAGGTPSPEAQNGSPDAE